MLTIHTAEAKCCWQERANKSKLSDGHGSKFFIYPRIGCLVAVTKAVMIFPPGMPRPKETCFEPRVIVGDVQ